MSSLNEQLRTFGEVVATQTALTMKAKMLEEERDWLRERVRQLEGELAARATQSASQASREPR